MRRIAVVAAILSMAAVVVLAATAWGMSGAGPKVFSFNRLVGVSGAFVGPTMPLRGIPGGGFPWVISEGQATLFANGEFEVEVQGLVIDPTNATAVAKGIAGTNPAPFFFATLSCLDSTGATVNVNTAAVSATSTGNATIQQTIKAPSPCFAPIVLVRGSFTGASSGPWFAVSGF